MNATMRAILDAALSGARCPTGGQLPYKGKQMRDMARAGEFLIEVFGKNFRRVTILTGPHAGKSTADPPRKRNGMQQQPYLTVSKAGTIRNGRHVESAAVIRSRVQPSLPRRMMAEKELDSEIAGTRNGDDPTPYHKLKPWQPPEFRAPHAFPDVEAKLRSGKG